MNAAELIYKDVEGNTDEISEIFLYDVIHFIRLKIASNTQNIEKHYEELWSLITVYENRFGDYPGLAAILPMILYKEDESRMHYIDRAPAHYRLLLLSLKELNTLPENIDVAKINAYLELIDTEGSMFNEIKNEAEGGLLEKRKYVYYKNPHIILQFKYLQGLQFMDSEAIESKINEFYNSIRNTPDLYRKFQEKEQLLEKWEAETLLYKIKNNINLYDGNIDEVIKNGDSSIIAPLWFSTLREIEQIWPEKRVQSEYFRLLEYIWDESKEYVGEYVESTLFEIEQVKEEYELEEKNMNYDEYVDLIFDSILENKSYPDFVKVLIELMEKIKHVYSDNYIPQLLRKILLTKKKEVRANVNILVNALSVDSNKGKEDVQGILSLLKAEDIEFISVEEASTYKNDPCFPYRNNIVPKFGEHMNQGSCMIYSVDAPIDGEINGRINLPSSIINGVADFGQLIFCSINTNEFIVFRLTRIMH